MKTSNRSTVVVALLVGILAGLACANIPTAQSSAEGFA
jgi:hypothetical protein